MKATTGYKSLGNGTSGLWLKIPSQGHAPLLLLEWVRRQSQVWFEAYQPAEEEDGTISFRFGTPGRNTMLRMRDCCDYINANLPQDSEEPVDEMSEAQKLAMAYSTALRSWLTERQMERCVSGEAEPDNFCDSNMAMNTAFIGVTGRLFTFFNDEEPDTEKQNEIDTNLCNAAHAIAINSKFRPEEKPIMVSIDSAEPVTIYDWIWDSVGPTEDFKDIALVNAIRNTIVGADVADTIDMVRTA